MGRRQFGLDCTVSGTMKRANREQGMLARKMAIAVVSAGICLCLLCLAYSQTTSTSVTGPYVHDATCYNNLLQIEASKATWYGYIGGTNTAPSWNDIVGYFRDGRSTNMPICPRGGVYTIGKLTEVATCSFGTSAPKSCHSIQGLPPVIEVTSNKEPESVRQTGPTLVAP